MQQCHTLIYKYISIVRNAYFMQCIVDGMVLVLLELFPVTQTTKCNIYLTLCAAVRTNTAKVCQKKDIQPQH